MILRGWLEKELKEQLDARGLEPRVSISGKIAILNNGDKSIVTDEEAVHEIFSSLEEKYTVDLYERAKENANGTRSISIVPVARVASSIAELLAIGVDSEFVSEIALTEFCAQVRQ